MRWIRSATGHAPTRSPPFGGTRSWPLLLLLVVVIVPTVGVAAAARAVTDKELIDKVEVTGLGLPSEMAEYVMNGASKVFGLWNPIDLGYLNAYVSYHLATEEITGAPGDTFDAGRWGKSRKTRRDSCSSAASSAG